MAKKSNKSKTLKRHALSLKFPKNCLKDYSMMTDSTYRLLKLVYTDMDQMAHNYHELNIVPSAHHLLCLKLQLGMVLRYIDSADKMLVLLGSSSKHSEQYEVLRQQIAQEVTYKQTAPLIPC